ncbi:hypothetical protein ACMFMG_003692 [Clarireedia jacksonii]
MFDSDMMNMLHNVSHGPQLNSSSSSTIEDQHAAWFDLVERVIISLDCDLRQARPTIRLIKTYIQKFWRLKQLSVEEWPSPILQLSEPGAIFIFDSMCSSDGDYQVMRKNIAKAFEDAVKEDGLSTRAPLDVTIVHIALVPKAPTEDWMVDLTTPISSSAPFKDSLEDLIPTLDLLKRKQLPLEKRMQNAEAMRTKIVMSQLFIDQSKYYRKRPTTFAL